MTEQTQREYIAAAAEQRETLKNGYTMLRETLVANGLEAEAELVEALYSAHVETFDLLVKALSAGMTASERVMHLVKPSG